MRRTPPPAFLALTIASALVLAASACGEERRGDRDLEIRVEVEPDPPTVGTAAVTVGVVDVDWRPRDGDRVVVTATRDDVVMAVDTAEGQGAGQYRVEALAFPVAGDWLLTVRVETRGGAWTEVDRRVEVSAGDEGG